LNVTVTVAGVVLDVFCEFTALYWKLTMVVAPVAGGAVGIAVKEPSGFNVTVPPAGLPVTNAAVIGYPAGLRRKPIPRAVRSVSATRCCWCKRFGDNRGPPWQPITVEQSVIVAVAVNDPPLAK